ncbi:MAG: hypothetical protein M3423_07450, partial [Actinomycetota bacterium]|nr:hypothetical protein [Actinomycetota bacterium]
GFSTFKDGDDGVRRTEVDSDRTSHGCFSLSTKVESVRLKFYPSRGRIAKVEPVALRLYVRYNVWPAVLFPLT